MPLHSHMVDQSLGHEVVEVVGAAGKHLADGLLASPLPAIFAGSNEKLYRLCGSADRAGVLSALGMPVICL